MCTPWFDLTRIHGHTLEPLERNNKQDLSPSSSPPLWLPWSVYVYFHFLWTHPTLYHFGPLPPFLFFLFSSFFSLLSSLLLLLSLNPFSLLSPALLVSLHQRIFFQPHIVHWTTITRITTNPHYSSWSPSPFSLLRLTRDPHYFFLVASPLSTHLILSLARKNSTVYVEEAL
jgi:hypothetical protein